MSSPPRCCRKERDSETGIEITDETPGGIIGVSGCLQRGLSGRFVFYCIRIPVKRKVLKVFFFQDFAQIGLGIQKLDLRLLEAGTFPASDVSGILTERTEVMRLQIIGRKTVLFQQRTPLKRETDALSQSLIQGAALSEKERAGPARA